MKTNQRPNGAKRPPAFVSRAERAFGRVARKLRAENQKLGLRAVVWSNGKGAIYPMKREMRDQLGANSASSSRSFFGTLEQPRRFHPIRPGRECRCRAAPAPRKSVRSRG